VFIEMTYIVGLVLSNQVKSSYAYQV